MKKIALVIAGMFLVTGAYAQSRLEWGAKAGLNLAGQMAKSCGGFGISDVRPAIYAGFFAEYAIGRRTGLQSELVYSMQGAGDRRGTRTLIEQLDYINIPILFKYYVNRKRSISIDAGPQFGYLIRTKYKGWEGTEKGYSLNKFDLSLGLGVTFRPDSQLDFGFRVIGGATEIGKTRTGGCDSSDNRNFVVQIGAGFRF